MELQRTDAIQTIEGFILPLGGFAAFGLHSDDSEGLLIVGNHQNIIRRCAYCGCPGPYENGTCVHCGAPEV